MRILFVNPKSPDLLSEDYNPNGVFSRVASKFIPFRKPLTFSLLAALTPIEHTVEIVEGSPYDINYEEPYDLVGITTTTCHAFVAYKIANDFRKHGVKVVIGGYHASALPGEAKKHADSVVIGEAEDIWPQLLEDIKNRKLQPYYNQTKPTDLKHLPHPRIDTYSKEKGLGIQATRGCPNECKFCSISNMRFGNIFRTRPIEDVIADIQLLPNKLFVFQDPSLTIDPGYSKQLFKEMKGTNKRFIASGNINVLGKDDDFLKLASDAGCISWVIGFESVSQESIDDINKKTNLVSEYLMAIEKIHDYGMIIDASFVFGFDYDTPDIFERTDEFVRQGEIDVPFVLRLIPYPGTPIFARFDEQNRILTKDWSKYHQGHVVFQPKHMTPEELFEKSVDLDREWHKLSRCVERDIRSLSIGIYQFFETASMDVGWKIAKFIGG